MKGGGGGVKPAQNCGAEICSSFTSKWKSQVHTGFPDLGSCCLLGMEQKVDLTLGMRGAVALTSLFRCEEGHFALESLYSISFPNYTDTTVPKTWCLVQFLAHHSCSNIPSLLLAWNFIWPLVWSVFRFLNGD